MIVRPEDSTGQAAQSRSDWSEHLLDDRTGSEIDDECPRKYWWTRLWGGRGLSPVDEPAYFRQGRILHEDLAEIAQREDYLAWIEEQIAKRLEDPPADQKSLEIVYRHLGWLAAWGLFIEPKLRTRYRTIQIEHELILQSPKGMWVPIIPDRVLEEISSGKLIYREYKTTLKADQKWQSSWQYQSQLHLGQEAIEQELGRPVSYAQIVGLMKGSYYTDSDHFTRLTHPYVWAYHNTHSDQWSVEAQRAAGWTNRPVWEFPGGLMEWVRRAGSEVALSQFPHSVAVFKNPRMIDQWFLRREYRQTKIAQLEGRYDFQTRAIFFPMHTKACEPAFGDRCPFVPLCWNQGLEDDPIGSGQFVMREPHHEVERVILKEKGLI